MARLMGKKAEKRAIKQAEFDERLEHEKRVRAFRDGRLNRFDAEELTQQLCAQGDAAKRAQAEQDEREKRELGARLRAGTI
jgi:hypothetical protein